MQSIQDKPERREVLLEKISYICTAVYIAALLYAFHHNCTIRDMNASGMTPIVVLTPLTVPVAFRLLHFKPMYEVRIVSTIFVYFTPLVGSSYHWYFYLSFDKVPHFSSGWFITTLAIVLYFYLKETSEFPDRKDCHVFLVFIDVMNIAVGEIWEFYGYAMLIFFNSDCINYYSQSVHDTITDILCIAMTGVLLTLLITCYHRAGKGNFFTNVYKELHEYSTTRE